MKKFFYIPVLAILTMTGCGQRLSNGQMLGMAASGAFGGYMGAQIGGGAWNLAFTALGAAGGVAGGYQLGRKLEESDWVFYNKITSHELAKSTDGKIFNWSNPETGNSGIIRPVSTYKMADGRVCRGYRSTVAFSDAVQSGVGTACQTANGTWQMISDDFS